jgi:hypothetical protein
MKVEKLYQECEKLVQSDHGQYDVTIEMMGDENQRELINDLYIKSYKDDNLGLLILKTESPICWS